MAKRVAPAITDDLKKKIQAAIKSKENKGKRGPRKENVSTVSIYPICYQFLGNNFTTYQKINNSYPHNYMLVNENFLFAYRRNLYFHYFTIPI